MIKRLLLILSLTIIFYSQIFAQISEGGIPPSFKTNELKSHSLQKKHKVDVNKTNINKLLREEAFNDNTFRPSPVATVIPVSYNLVEDGEWTVFENKTRICRLRISSPEAQGIILSYDKFYIPRNSKLFIYSGDKTQILGAYTSETNPSGGKFSTEMIYGEDIVLEYVQGNTEPAEIIITGIGHGFQNITNYYKNSTISGFNQSGNCQVNVNCSEGSNWQQEKKGVARIYALIGNAWYRASASLVNNTKNDKSGLILTAAHAIQLNQDLADMETIQFYFNYEFGGCANESQAPNNYKTLIGADLLVVTPFYGGSDGALLKLKNDIPENYDVFFNGWTTSEQLVRNGVTIHHPLGDVKKISTYTTPLITDTYYDKNGSSMTGAHWRVTYSATQNGFGTTEGGSSGSPIFNSNKLIVGTLSGGSSSCSNKSGSDFFGKLSYHWDKNTNGQFMKPYLDPLNSGITELNGIPNIGSVVPPIINPSDNAPEAYAFWSEDKGKNELTVVLKKEIEHIKKITIVSFSGYDIYRGGNISNNTLKITTTNWPNGLYIVYLETNNSNKLNFKIVK